MAQRPHKAERPDKIRREEIGNAATIPNRVRGRNGKRIKPLHAVVAEKLGLYAG